MAADKKPAEPPWGGSLEAHAEGECGVARTEK